MERERGSATTEWALLCVVLAVVAAFAAISMLRIVSFELPDFPTTVQPATKE